MKIQIVIPNLNMHANDNLLNLLAILKLLYLWILGSHKHHFLLSNTN